MKNKDFDIVFCDDCVYYCGIALSVTSMGTLWKLPSCGHEDYVTIDHTGEVTHGNCHIINGNGHCTRFKPTDGRLFIPIHRLEAKERAKRKMIEKSRKDNEIILGPEAPTI